MKLLKLLRLRYRLRHEIALLDGTMDYMSTLPVMRCDHVRLRQLTRERRSVQKALNKLLEIHPYF